MPVPVPLKTERPEGGKLNKAKYVSSPDGNSVQIPLPYHQRSSTFFGYPGGPPYSKDSQARNLSRTSMCLDSHGPGVEKGVSNIPIANLLPGTVPLAPLPSASYTPVEWDWDTEHEDRRREAKADFALHGAQPFQVDRRVLKDVVREKTNCEVGRITFLSSGTFHKAYLVTLVDTRELVARVARRFMPRLKTQSEVATMQYLREKAAVPVPDVYFYDSNPYNRLGGEYILMSKASGMPLSQAYHSMSNEEIKTLFKNMASIIIPLFAQRFSHVGSLYFDSLSPVTPTVSSSVMLSSSPTPTATHPRLKSFPFMPLMSATPTCANHPKPAPPRPHLSAITSASGSDIHVGPIVSWPFFGSNRGDLLHPSEIDRGPWPTTRSYLEACVVREIVDVKRENEGKSAPHRLHLDPEEIRSSRHHHLDAVPDDQSDDSDEWDAQESEDEWEGPGDAMYRDYRRMQRSTFLVAHTMRREECVRKEMSRWMRVMDRLGAHADHAGTEEFGLDCHDLNLENVFVDVRDHTRITCVIDWESTTTRPLWACAHLPAFVQSSPFTVKLFREVVAEIANSRSHNYSSQPTLPSLAATAREWLHYEAVGARLRLAHRCAEWDGWEEGLVESILGPEEGEEEWFKDAESTVEDSEAPSVPSYDACVESEASFSERSSGALLVASLKRRKQAGRIPLKKEKEREQMLTTTGDICGGRGGELGRRLEAWLSVNGNGRRRGEDSQDEYDGEAE